MSLPKIQVRPSPVPAGRIVGRGCVGECGSASTVTYRIIASFNKLMSVQRTQSSLCPNMGAFAYLFVNGILRAHGDISGGQRIYAEARPGAVVVAHVVLIPLFNGISCVRLGNCNFALIEQDFVG